MRSIITFYSFGKVCKTMRKSLQTKNRIQPPYCQVAPNQLPIVFACRFWSANDVIFQLFAGSYLATLETHENDKCQKASKQLMRNILFASWLLWLSISCLLLLVAFFQYFCIVMLFLLSFVCFLILLLLKFQTASDYKVYLKKI